MHPDRKRYSGIDPHLAVTHDTLGDQGECGIGAVAAQGGRLYFIAYPANHAKGGSGRIYSIDADGTLTQHPESAGGTHASRLLHRATGALLLGNSVIGPDGSIRSFDTSRLIGRLTGASVHLRAPEEWAYLHTMEDGLYEVNLKTMDVRCLRRDILARMADSKLRRSGAYAREKLPGDHGKGGYTGQGMMVYSNNGHGGVLAEWNGQGDAQARANWTVIDRNKYTEITGPGGICGPDSAGDPIWALGWDERSVLLNVRHAGGWTRYRLPKASYTQDADHGWFTEWPRIRRAGDEYLMCMHGMFYSFPGQFAPRQTGGLRPLARHLKMISDWEVWHGEIAFACDDASAFDNPLLGRVQSNLWFAARASLDHMSMPAGWGGVYVREPVAECVPSDPFFVGGFTRRVLGISIRNDRGATFTLETDAFGDGAWTPALEVHAPGTGHFQYALPDDLPGDWVRLVSDWSVSECTAYFHLRMRKDVPRDERLVRGLHAAGGGAPYGRGRVVPLPGTDLRLGYWSDAGYYEAGGDLRLEKAEAPAWPKDPEASPPGEPKCRITPHSVLVIDAEGNAFHLPRLHADYDGLEDRPIREVVTERSLMNLHGTVYELPRFESGGVRRIKPVTTHGLRISDFCSWRGMLVLSGVDAGAEGEHILRSEDGKAALWLGNVDDLWRMGAPRGEGGPIQNAPMRAGEASAPFLMIGYDRKHARFQHDSDGPVRFTLDVDFAGDGMFLPWQAVEVPRGEGLSYAFPEYFSAHWIRVRADRDCRATAWFTYT